MRLAPIAALLLPMVASIAQTTNPAVSLESRFLKADRDGDGRLSAEELPMPVLFAAIDADRDGYVSRSEAAGYFARAGRDSSESARGGVEGLFVRADRDGDGRVTPAELPNGPIFKQLDADANGAVTIEEARARLERLLPKLRQTPAMDASQASAEPSRVLEPIRQGPVILKGSEVGIGRQVGDLELVDQADRTRRLSQMRPHAGTCIAFTSVTCPVSKRYLPVLSRLCADLGALDISFVIVNPMRSESREDFHAAMKGHGMGGIWVSDRDQSLTRALGAATTTEVFLFDAARTLVYRGAVDDQYGISYNLETPRHEYLRKAVDAMLAGRRPGVAATVAPGCELDGSSRAVTDAPAGSAITYYRDVSRILQHNCVECHRAGGLAPFSLEQPDEVLDRVKTIKRVVGKGTMPPWFAAPPEKGQPSLWINDHSLSSRDKADLLAWIEGDRIMGDPADAPVPRQFPAEWQIGKPDLVLQLPQPVKVRAEGVMPYQNLVVETSLSEDRWVQAIEIQPTDREVVHHVLVFVEGGDKPAGLGQRARGAAGDRRIAGADGEDSRGYFGIYVPGNSTVVYPEGFARRLPKGSRLRFQMHYTPKGSATEDQTRIGFVFAKEKPDHVVQVVGISNPKLVIPPHAANHSQTASIPVPATVRLLAFAPHMHLRGKAFRYDAILPDGSRRTLLDIPRYDFNWQLAYRYAEPVEIPAGSRIEVTGWFDNSVSNPANPDPDKTVRWGPQTFDEMLLGYVEYFIPSRSVTADTASAH